MWSKGDGALIRLYPHLVYMDYAPNSAELLLLAMMSTLILAAFPSGVGAFPNITSISHGLRCLVSIVLANVIHDAYRHLFRHPERTQSVNTTISGMSWCLAVFESTLIRISSEAGRLIGMLERHEYSFLMHRFDWFAGHPAYGKGPKREERRNSVERIGLCMAIAIFVSYILP